MASAKPPYRGFKRKHRQKQTVQIRCESETAESPNIRESVQPDEKPAQNLFLELEIRRSLELSYGPQIFRGSTSSGFDYR